MKINIGDRVSILAGEESGGWGIVKLVEDDEYHVAPYGGTDVRLYNRDEIRKSRKK